MISAFLPGFSLGFSLILAIGAQNAFVLRQGLRLEHVFAVCLTCALSDALLIGAGVAGFDRLIQALPWLSPVMRIGGALYLLFFAWKSFRAAFAANEALVPTEDRRQSLKAVLLACLAFTWLNPHVYLDTVLLIGSVSAGFEGQKLAFASGAMTASFVFFFSLGYGARHLRPLFARPGSWRVLEVLIGLVMLALALKLLLE